MEKQDELFMREALQEAALAAAAGETPVGAVLVKDGQIICRAHNRREELHDPTAHAEVLCLRDSAAMLGTWRLTDCTLYVTLEPCPMCAGSLVMSRLGRCVYGAYDPKGGCCGSVYDLPADPAFGAPTRWTAGVLEAECRAALEAFFRERRRSGACAADAADVY